MKNLIILMVVLLSLLVNVVEGISKDTFKGVSKICDDIGYLSTSCKDVDVLPFEYKDKDVAIEKAKQPTINNITNTTIKVEDITKKEDKNDVIIKTWFDSK